MLEEIIERHRGVHTEPLVEGGDSDSRYASDPNCWVATGNDFPSLGRVFITDEIGHFQGGMAADFFFVIVNEGLGLPESL